VVKLNKIYTRTGDDGTTGLSDGRRVSKNSLRVRAYGDVDETNSVIGMARLHVDNAMLDGMLSRIQNDLFDVGADLATPQPNDGAKDEEWALRIIQTQIDRVERDLDTLNADLQPLNSFVLPGGSPASAHLHLARTIARRAERRAVALMTDEPINPLAVTYLNRVSDFLFVAARWKNDMGRADVKWVPGENR